MSLRIKLILIGVLLLLAVSTTAIAAGTTLQAFHRFQEQNALATAGDVRSVQSWMTIPYIAHICHVPASYLYRSLHIPDQPTFRHATLQALATRYRRPVNEIVDNVQNAIKTYRKEHPTAEIQPLPGSLRRYIDEHDVIKGKTPGTGGEGS